MVAKTIKLPNLRKHFVPDPGYTIFDCDLDRADLQVVVWEADDEELKLALKEGVDLHLFNAQSLFNLPFNMEDLKDPNILKDIQVRFKKYRQFAKSWIHGTNYGGSARTMAKAAGVTVRESEKLQKLWFSKHPGIKDWHERTEKSLRETRSVSNKFGYRCHFFDRIEGILPEALAWVPQSTVAITINLGLLNLDENVPEVDLLLQVHDSLVGQYPTHMEAEILPKIKENLHITIPYDDPLVIGVGIKTSLVSWGDCKDREWP